MRITKNQKDNSKIVLQELTQQGIKNPLIRDAILLVAFKESGFLPKVEKCYTNTNNDSIRRIFSRLRNQNDEFINNLKKDCKAFFDYVYNGVAGNGPDDGYNFRGRGFHQITGEANYRLYGSLIKQDLLKNPDLVLQPKIASQVLAQYYLATPTNWLKKSYGYNSLNDVNNWNDAKKIIYHVTAGIGKSKKSLFETDATKGWQYINQNEKKILSGLSENNDWLTTLVLIGSIVFFFSKSGQSWIKKLS